jgi:hypothetical protein
MKRSANSSVPGLAAHKPVPENTNSQAAAVKKKTREQLIDGLVARACEVTGVRSKEISDRIIIQVANGLVQPKPQG